MIIYEVKELAGYHRETDFKLQTALIRIEWKKLNAEISSFAIVEYISKKHILYIKVAHSSVAHYLSTNKENLKEKLIKNTGIEIKDIKFKMI